MALVEVHRRTISEYGIADLGEITHPTAGQIDDWTRVEIWAALRQEPTNKYLNLEWNPDKGFYGRVTVSGDESLGLTTSAIRKTQPIEFKIQLIWEWRDDARVTHLLIGCATQKILQSIADSYGSVNNPPIAIIPLPVPEAIHCPARIIRVAPYSDSIIDIIVLAENATKLLIPLDTVCQPFIPVAVPDNTPQGDSSSNVPLGDLQTPSQAPVPSPPYTPSTGDNGETPQPPVQQPLPGQMARIRMSGFYASCQNRTPEPYSAVSVPFTPPITVAVVESGNCTTGSPIPYYAIRVTYNGNETYDVATVATTVPDYVIEYYTP